MPRDVATRVLEDSGYDLRSGRQRARLDVRQRGHADVRLIPLGHAGEQLGLREDLTPRPDPVVALANQGGAGFPVNRPGCLDRLLMLALRLPRESQRGPEARVTWPLPLSSVTWKYVQRFDVSKRDSRVAAKKMSWVKTMT